MNPLLLVGGAALAVAVLDEDDAPGGLSGLGAVDLTGGPQVPGVALPLPGPDPVQAVQVAPTSLHSNGTGVINAAPGAITVLRTRIATLAGGRHWKLRARAMMWSKGMQRCAKKQWEVFWSWGSQDLRWEPETWNAGASKSCPPVPYPLGSGTYLPAFELEREGVELWLRMTTVNGADGPATYDLQSWSTGGGDYP